MCFLLSYCNIDLNAINDSKVNCRELKNRITSSISSRTASEFKKELKEITNYLSDIDKKELDNFLINKNQYFSKNEFFLIQLGYCISLYESKEYELALRKLPSEEKQNENAVTLAIYYEYKGNIERYIQKHAAASKSFLNSINYYEQLNDIFELSRIYYKLGVLNLDIKNYFLAKDYLERSVEHARATSNKKLIKTTTSTLASYYHTQKEYDKALNLYFNVLDKMSISKVDSARLLMNIGSIYVATLENKNAEEYFTKSLKLREELGDYKAVVNAYNNLGQLYLSNRSFDRSHYYLRKSYAYAVDNKMDNVIIPSSYNLVELYMNMNKVDSALKYFHIYVDLREKVAKEDVKKQLIELDKKYKTLEKDNQIAQLEKEDALNHSRLKTQNIILAIVASFLLILLVVGYLIERQRKELVQSRRRLLRQKEDISGMNEQLRVSNLAKDRILSVIGHDLRGPVGGLKELIELYMELPEHDPQDIQNLLKAAREASTSTYHLLENLLSWANSQRGEIVYNPVATPLLPLVKQTVQLLDSSINPRQVSFEYDIPGALVVNVDLNMLRTIIRNLVSNALKYSPEKGVIKIQVFNENSQLKFCVCDQGMGMTADETKDIFKKKETYFIGSEMTAKGTGLGLILCKEFVERHGGTIWIKSKKDVGTQVWFSIPHKRTNVASEVHLQSTTAQ